MMWDVSAVAVLGVGLLESDWTASRIQMAKRGIGGRVAMEVAAGGVLEGVTGMGRWVGAIGRAPPPHAHFMRVLILDGEAWRLENPAAIRV